MQARIIVGSGIALSALLAFQAGAQGIPRTEIKLDDSYVLGVRANIDQEEIETARWAATHAYSKDVRAFAQSLTRGHAKAQNAAQELAQRLKIDLRITGDTDQAIIRRQAATDASLRSLSGPQFDRAFLTAVRDEHTAEIDKVNSWYASVAVNDSVKAYLHEIMPTLIKHQQTAEKLLASSKSTVAIK